jgi:hypothetical protein
MDPAHLHLMVNHLPILGSMLSLPLIGIAAWRRTEKGPTLAYATLLTLGALGAVVSLRSGEPAEERVEDLPGVSERWIEEHEERAETATVLAVITALGALGAMAYGWKRDEGTPAVLTGAVFVGALATSGAMGWTGLAGGQIHHPELRAEGDQAAAGEGAAGEAGETREEEEAEGER